MYIAKAYVKNSQVIIVPEDSAVQAKADLEGKIIGLQKGSSSLDALNADPISQKVGQVVEYADNVSAFLDLKAGRVDVFVVDEVAGRYIMENN
jgi:polar amino acid transport system substrate-binding protein